MPERDDMPDPVDEAYVRAEQALDDEAAQAARRARVLAAVARDAEAPPAPAPSLRRPIRRYGGWLAAAGVAGLGVWTAQQVYRPAPRREEVAPAPAKAPAPSIAQAQGQAPAPLALAPSSASPATSSAPPPPVTARRRPPIAESARAAPPPEVAPPSEVAPPPPLPIPPVEKPIAQAPAFAPPPPPRPLTAPAVVAKPNASTQETVVVTGSRLQRREFAAPAPVISGALASKALDGPMRLREAATAGRTAEIETLLAQGVPVDAADETGETALMKSIEAGQRDAAALLRRHGASLDQKNRAGVSAREMAATRDDPALDQALRAPVTPSGAAPP
jgi:hypothetical protein